MKVLVLAPALYDTSPGQRFRIEQWARYLEHEAYHFEFVPFENAALHAVLYQPQRYICKAALILRALLRRLGTLARIRRFDLVFVPREAALLGPAFLERLIVLFGVPLVYDFDDPIWLTYRSPINHFFSRLKWPSKTSTICRLATRVIVGNHLLADWARQHSDCVDVVPITIDLANYPWQCPRNEINKEDRPIVLGWTGSHSTVPFLNDIVTPLNRLARLHRFTLKVISHTDEFQLPGAEFEVESRRWNAATEAEDLAGCDIGLGPFPNSGWTPWRCHGKVLQYMALGLPCVVSDIGILPEYIQDGVNGFLATGDDAWLDKLIRLMTDKAMRLRMGAEGRKVIEQRYAASVWAPKVKDILDDAAMRGKTRQRVKGRT